MPIATPEPASTPRSITALMEDHLKAIESPNFNGLTGLSTGLTALDDLTHGLHLGELVVIGSAPVSGKTALMLSMAWNLAICERISVGICSPTMAGESLAVRLLSSGSRVELRRIRRSHLLGDERVGIQQAMEEFREAPLFVDDAPNPSLSALCASVRRMVTEHAIQVVFIDHMRQVRGPDFPTRDAELAHIADGLQALARELCIAVVCAVPLSSAANNAHWPPYLEDLTECAEVMRIADTVMLVQREVLHHRDDTQWLAAHPEAENEAEVCVIKQRHGPAGVVELQWDGATASLRNPVCKAAPSSVCA